MAAVYSPKLLKARIEGIELPSKEKILPHAACEKQIKTRRFAMPIYIKKFATAVVAVVLSVFIGLQGVWILTNNTVTPLEPENKKPVVYAHKIDSFSYFQDGSVYDDAFVSEILKERLKQYEGQDVLFRVIVGFPYLKKYEEGFVTSAGLAKQIQENLAWAEELSAKIEKINDRLHPPEKGLTQQEIEELRREREDLEEERKARWDEYDALTDKEDEERKAYRAANLAKEKDFLKQIGATAIKSFDAHSEFPDYALISGYIMELTAEQINQMIERGTFNIRMAPPERTGQYDKKITDTLSFYLEQMLENETMEIAAVCAVDKNNYYAYKQGLTSNFSYNAEFYKEWAKEISNDKKWWIPFNASVEEYVSDIIKRNDIEDDRIISGDLPKNGVGEVIYPHAVSYLEDTVAGFNARLTKEQILKLVKDGDVKAIYAVVNKKMVYPNTPIK